MKTAENDIKPANCLRRRLFAAVIIAAAALAAPAPALAYIGPGAGFALATSFLTLFTTAIIVIGVMAALPLRLLARTVRGTGRRRSKDRKVNRVVILGLDGLDPGIARPLMDAGLMPNFKAVADKGHFGPLNTTCPPISPVAWSTFATGVNPGRHNIYDFLTWDRASNLPKLSSCEIGGTTRMLRLGPIALPFGKPAMKLLRKGVPFWDYAASRGEPSAALRVPITFPAVKSRAFTLSGMCAPDLRGTQGTYSFFTNEPGGGEAKTGGERKSFSPGKNGALVSELTGAPDPLNPDKRNLTLPFSLRVDEKDPQRATLMIKGCKPARIEKGKYSEWIEVSFKAGAGIKVPGIVRFLLRETEPHVKLYASPVNIDPARPALPVSWPQLFSVWLAKLLGPFSTLGLAEDTWALNHGDISPDEFLDQVWLNHADREKALNLTLDRFRSGLVICVFDTPDRIQHMFWKQYAENKDKAPSAERDPLTAMYLKMDELLGRTLSLLNPKDALLVISDHGVRGFGRCFNINAWLLKNGYLHVKADADPEADYYQSVDWSRTRAFGLGLTGIFLNIKGKGAAGIVEPGAEVAAIKKEIAGKLLAEIDAANGRAPVLKAHDSAVIYDGPYVENAPDIVVCYADGYRTSWDSVTGKTSGEIFSDNDREWSGDHCADPRLVPGIILSNLPVTEEKPHIRDISATALSLLGIPAPEHMQGKNIL